MTVSAFAWPPASALRAAGERGTSAYMRPLAPSSSYASRSTNAARTIDAAERDQWMACM